MMSIILLTPTTRTTYELTQFICQLLADERARYPSNQPRVVLIVLPKGQGKREADVRGDDRCPGGLNGPINGGDPPVEDLQSDKSSWQIYLELLRNLLREQRPVLQEIAGCVPVEVVFKALIIREFMEQHGILEVRKGIREFYSFQRRQIARLKFAPAPEDELPKAS